MDDTRASLERLVEEVLVREGRTQRGSARASATITTALFQSLVRQRRVDPDVPEELSDQAPAWLMAGRAAEGGV